LHGKVAQALSPANVLSRHYPRRIASYSAIMVHVTSAARHKPPAVRAFFLAALAFALVRTGTAADQTSFRFAILGDRTGEAQPGVFEQAWREIAAERPAFVVATGDMIEGLQDDAAPTEWLELDRILQPFSRFRLYAAPGNHDIWSQASEALYQRHTDRPPHYSFDYENAHVTVLDNSRSDELPAAELQFLENDLKAHAAQPLKFVFMHRPFWLIDVAARNPNFALHRIARQYGVRYVIAGHLHQLLHLDLEGVTYISMMSSGGHLRASGEYKDGWFFGHALVEVNAVQAGFKIEELNPPRGQGRVTRLTDWGMLGLAPGIERSPARSR
jgi:predicted phosphodiesterase